MRIIQFLLSLIFVLTTLLSFAQITLTPGQTVIELTQNVLTGPSLEALNITFNGSAANANNPQQGVQFFSTVPGTDFPFSSGVLLRTNGAPSVNNDPDLNALSAPFNVTNGSIVEFDFIASGDTMNFQYIFASSEYSGFTCSQYNDAFGFFLSGPGISGPFTNNAINLATIPGTNIPVAINTVNSGIPSSGNPTNCINANPNWQDHTIYFTTSFNPLFQPIGGGYNGATVALIAASGLICGETYHIKLGVANVGDQALNSAVFLESESFQVFGYQIVVEPSIEGPALDGLFAEGCTSATLMVTRIPDSQITDTICVPVHTAGTLDPSTDLQDFPTEICFPPGVDTVYFDFIPIQDGIDEGMEELTITLISVNACGFEVPSTVTLFVADYYDFSFDLTPDQIVGCVAVTADAEVTNIAGSVEPYTFSWAPNGEQSSSITMTGGLNDESVTYLVTVTDFCGHSKIDSVTIHIEINEFTFDITPDQSINCLNTILQAEVSNIQGGTEPFNFSWSPNGEDTQIITLNPGNGEEENITFVVTVTDFCGLSAIDSTVLNVNIIPFTFDLTPNQVVDCTTETITAEVTNIQGGVEPYTYSWLPSGEETSSITITPNPNVNEPITFIVTVTDFCGLVVTDSIIVSVAPNEFTFDLTPNQTVQCLTTTADASVTNIQGGFEPFTYSWAPNGEETSTITMIPGTNTQDTIIYTVTVTDVCGNSVSDTVTLIVNETLGINPSSNPTLCGLETGIINFNPFGHNNPMQYQLAGPGGILLTSNQNSQNNLPSGWYYITASDAFCSTQDSVFVGLLDGPTAGISGEPTVDFSPLTVTFSNLSENANNYFWDFGNDQTLETVSSENQTMTFEGDGPLDILVCLVAIQPGCTDTACMLVTILEFIPPPVFQIPNVFTPNNDGSNDSWSFYNKQNVEFIELTILNRWGNVVFEQTSDNPAWNGKLPNGNDAAEGVYFYKYFLQGRDGFTTHEGHGFLQLIRE